MTCIKPLAITWIATLAVFLALDAFWLGVAGGSIYRDALGGLMLDGFRVIPALLFYALHVTGIVVFVLPLGRQRASFWVAAGFGAFFGLCAYGTYDLTNHAVLRVWTWQLTVIDMAWGAFVTAAASAAGAFARSRCPPAR